MNVRATTRVLKQRLSLRYAKIDVPVIVRLRQKLKANVNSIRIPKIYLVQESRVKSKISYRVGNWQTSPPLRRETAAAGPLFLAAATTSG